VEFIEAGKFVACSACGRLYSCRYDESRRAFNFEPQHGTFTCKVCGKFNSMDAYDMKPGNVIECLGCGEKFKVEMQPLLTRIVSGGTDNPS
jgi:hypothetical protein